MNESMIPSIEANIPDFVHEEYPRFVQFLRDYYTWMELQENFMRIAGDFRDNLEPSLENDPYVDSILRDLGWDHAGDIRIKKSLLLAALRDFYLSRGTPASFDLIWKLLFNSSVEIRYPRKELLVPSASAYGERFFIYVDITGIQIPENLQYIIENVSEYGGNVLGLLSRSRIDLESVSIIYGFRKEYLQIEILQPLVPFIIDEIIRIDVNGTTYDGVLHKINNIKIQNGGRDYSVGDKIAYKKTPIAGNCYVSAIGSGPVEEVVIGNGGVGEFSVGDKIKAIRRGSYGSGFSAVVSRIEPIGGGSIYKKITGIRILSPGYGYDRTPELVLKTDGFVSVQPILNARGSKLGSIEKIVISEPSIGPIPRGSLSFLGGDTRFDISTNTGVGASLIPEFVPMFSKKGWTDHIGFIGENSRIIDSHKYQQFSYSIHSPVQFKNYDEFVSEYLHTAGYVRTGSCNIESEGQFFLSSQESEKFVKVNIFIEHDPLPIHWECISSIEVEQGLMLDDGSTDALGIVVNNTTEPLKV